MYLPQTKRRRVVAVNSLQAKVQNLPLLCVEAICKFTPTSRLVRLYSSAVPLPGACWSYGLGAVLKKRLPLSLSDDSPYHQAATPRILALFDSGGAKVATIIQPEEFRFSPLCQFVECAFLTVRAMYVSRWATGTELELYVVRGKALFSQLSKLTELTLVVRDDNTPQSEQFTAYGDLLDPRNLAHLLPQLTSFEISIVIKYIHSPILVRHLVDLMREMPLHEMPCLRRLVLPEKALRGVMQSAMCNSPRRRGTRLTLSGLTTLGASQYCQGGASYGDSVSVRPEMLRFVAISSCTNVSTLSLIVDGDFKAYLAAFRALASLNTLGMYLFAVNGLTLDPNETFGSVVDLRFACANANAQNYVFAITPRFPSTRTIAFESHRTDRDADALDLAMEFCEKRLLPNVASLRCFWSTEFSSCTSARLLRFLGSPKLPEAVDLSQVSFENLAHDPTLLTQVYIAMQSNSASSLLLRGPAHREAVQRLEDYAALLGESCSTSSWVDRDLGGQPGMARFRNVSQQTNAKIVGRKASGNLKGEQFTIRVVHQLAKRSTIFD